MIKFSLLILVYCFLNSCAPHDSTSPLKRETEEKIESKEKIEGKEMAGYVSLNPLNKLGLKLLDKNIEKELSGRLQEGISVYCPAIKERPAQTLTPKGFEEVTYNEVDEHCSVIYTFKKEKYYTINLKFLMKGSPYWHSYQTEKLHLENSYVLDMDSVSPVRILRAKLAHFDTETHH